LALATAMALYGLSHIEWASPRANFAKAIRYLSDISYSTFVSHFAVIIAISGLWEKLDLQGPAAALGVTAFAIMACWMVGAAVQKLSDLSLRRMQAH
jgi:peptidoglycan/LPS O-acetylase OafA/YrhL